MKYPGADDRDLTHKKKVDPKKLPPPDPRWSAAPPDQSVGKGLPEVSDQPAEGSRCPLRTRTMREVEKKWFRDQWQGKGAQKGGWYDRGWGSHKWWDERSNVAICLNGWDCYWWRKGCCKFRHPEQNKYYYGSEDGY